MMISQARLPTTGGGMGWQKSSPLSAAVVAAIAIAAGTSMTEEAAAQQIDVGPLSGLSREFRNTVSGTEAGAEYRFSLTKPETVHVAIFEQTAGLRATLLDAANAVIADTQAPFARPITLSGDLEAGHYRLTVRGSGATTPYAVALSAHTDPGVDRPQSLSVGTAAPVAKTIMGRLGNGDHEDVYHFNVANADHVILQTGAIDAAIGFTLHDGTGRLLASTEVTAGKALTMSGPLPSGAYYLRAAYDGTAESSYRFVLAIDAKASNEPEQATVLGEAETGTTTIGGVVTVATPADYYAVTLPVAGYLAIALNGLVSDVNLGLYDHTGLQIARAESPGTAVDQLQGRFAAGDYFVVVQGQGDDSPYLLSVTGVPEALVGSPIAEAPADASGGTTPEAETAANTTD